MCGRINQASPLETYLQAMQWTVLHDDSLPAGPRHNIPPGTSPIVLHQLAGRPCAARMFWGYSPRWYEKSPAINARLDSILRRSPFWKATLTRRVIVPVDGWFEWTGNKGDRQPWFIYARDIKPVLLAGISAWADGADPTPDHGFAIVTDDAAGGLVDVHDRRPIALPPDSARAWADPNTSIDDALSLLSTPRPEDAFAWHTVTRKVGNVRYQAPDATTLLHI